MSVSDCDVSHRSTRFYHKNTPQNSVATPSNLNQRSCSMNIMRSDSKDDGRLIFDFSKQSSRQRPSSQVKEHYSKNVLQFEDSMELYSGQSSDDKADKSGADLEMDESAGDTESSDEMDAQLLLHHMISDERYEQIKAKMSVTKQAPDKVYSSLSNSQECLVKGIRATKLNWSSSDYKNVVLKLSSDLKYFYYERVG